MGESTRQIAVNGRLIGPTHSTYVVAEISANHHQRFDEAVALLHAAHDAGADAVKLQTYTPDSMTIRSDKEYFTIRGTGWHGRRLWDLYREASTPWEWHADLFSLGREIGIDVFSTPFDAAAVELLEELNAPVYKIASFELIDIPLIERVARIGRPMIMSTGMAELAEIQEAVDAARSAGAREIALLKCNSAYPAPAEEMNLRTIPHMADTFDLPVGLSDHTLGIAAAVAAVTLGACIIEKHLTLSRAAGGPDGFFSMEPAELKALIEAVRFAEKSLGEIRYRPTASELDSRAHRRSLFIVEDMRAGDEFTPVNVRVIRPGQGLHPRYLSHVMGRRVTADVERGTPLRWTLVG